MEIKEELIQSCQEVGKRIPIWIQGPGGNLSVKDGDNLYIKASGARLDEVTATNGLATASLKIFKKLWKPESEDAYSELIRECAIQGRPSMETGFHALLPKKWVAHFHALSSLLMAYQHAQDPRRFQVFWNSVTRLRFRVLEAIMPGLRLSENLATTPDIDCFLMTNHGVVLQSDRPLKEALQEFEKIERAFLQHYGYTLEALSADALKELELRIYFPDSAVFVEKIEAITEKTRPGTTHRTLKADARTQDKNAFELLWGTETLTRAEPSLSELPLEISQKVANLPTELIRKGKA